MKKCFLHKQLVFLWGIKKNKNYQNAQFVVFGQGPG
jgi:hypothetical protein